MDAIFYQVQVLDNQDPMMLGRVRARLLTDNYQDIVRAITDPPWNEEKDKWTNRDPFIFNPLLPYFMYSVPKVNEMCQIIYVDKNFKYQNQYYVQNTFSSPTTTTFEYYVGGNKFTGTGTQLKNPKPLKNQDGTYTDQAIHKGVFPEPGDNGVLGRGSADVIVQQDTILMRAGKYQGTELIPNVVPVGNPRRGFVQLSRFNTTKFVKPNKIISEIDEAIVSVKYLIEWVVTNPENTFKKFNGSVYLYQLKFDLSTNSKNLTVGSEVKESLKSLVYSSDFNMLDASETAGFINAFIQNCNDKNVSQTGITLFTNEDNKFPIFYRPNNFTYSWLKPSSITSATAQSQTAFKNLTEIFSKVKLLPVVKQGGYGLIYKKSTVGKPLQTSSTIVPQEGYSSNPITYGAFGSDKVFLLSHNSSIPGKGKINFENTLYGISGDQFVDEIIPKTSSLVRGEELMELINMMARFLVSHTHAYPGLSPVPISQDGSNVQDILTELNSAATKILNDNIRLN
jgi:hypothetical protein